MSVLMSSPCFVPKENRVPQPLQLSDAVPEVKDAKRRIRSGVFIRSFLTPALHEVFDDLFCRLGGVGGKDRFGGMLA